MKYLVKIANWQGDLYKVEKAIAKMFNKGKSLSSIEEDSFYFEECEPKEAKVIIGYKGQNSSLLSKSLKSDGWEMLYEIQEWQILVNFNEDSKLIPSRGCILEHQKKIRKSILRAYILTFAVIDLILIIEIIFRAITGKEYGFLLVGLIGIIWIITMFSRTKSLFKEQRNFWLQGYKLVLNNMKLLKLDLNNDNIQGETLTMKAQLDMFISENLSKTIEKKAMEGFYLEYVGDKEMIFTKNEKKKFKYVVDKIGQINPMYVTYHKNNGWELCKCASSGSYLWRKSYDDKAPVFNKFINSTKDKRIDRDLWIFISLAIVTLVILLNHLGFTIVGSMGIVVPFVFGLLLISTYIWMKRARR